MRNRPIETIKIVWKPITAGNFQNNFLIGWYDDNLGSDSSKTEKVSVFGSALKAEDCNTVENASSLGSVANQALGAENVSNAVVIDGQIIGKLGKML